MANGLDVNRIARQNPLYRELDDWLDVLNLTDNELVDLFWFTFGANYDNAEYLRRLKYRLLQFPKERYTNDTK